MWCEELVSIGAALKGSVEALALVAHRCDERYP